MVIAAGSAVVAADQQRAGDFRRRIAAETLFHFSSWKKLKK